MDEIVDLTEILLIKFSDKFGEPLERAERCFTCLVDGISYALMSATYAFFVPKSETRDFCRLATSGLAKGYIGRGLGRKSLEKEGEILLEAAEKIYPKCYKSLMDNEEENDRFSRQL